MVASMASQVASSSSSDIRRAYDVFFSFRGEDTRKTFTKRLHEALNRKGVVTYIDNDLRRGEEISAALLRAIDESRISIVILSRNYASSSWCLDELVRILECKRTNQQIVLPLFYKVHPLDVRRQRKSFGEALAKLEERFKGDARLQKWKAALTEVADSTKWRLRKKGNESEFIKEIVQWVSRIVNRTYLNITAHPVGVESRAQEINSLLSVGLNDIRMIGIFGLGGIGKTTVAKDIYNSTVHHFEASCFLTDISKRSKQEFGLIQLQKTLLSETRGKIGNLKFDNVDQGISMIKKRIGSKRVLLILDDVDRLVQLKTLAGSHNWFGSGSRIIVTTRNRNLLTRHEVDSIYKVEGLDHDEALQLFSWHAFKKDRPDEDYLELTEDAIHYCGGLPLALTVLGADLFGRSVHQWRSLLDKYKIIPHKSIQGTLRISYDGLDDNEKNIFLDIACFFNGWDADFVIKILDSCGYFPNTGIKVLIDKSLVTIDNCNRFVMHQLLQAMGREIVRLESPKEPGRRSRLWFYEDVRHVFEENAGTNKIQGIVVNLPERDIICLHFKAFQKMRKLRIFINHNACFSKGPSFLSNELRLLDWPEYPVESLPSNFRGENLFVFRMRTSCLKGLKGFQTFHNLTILDFSNSKFLRNIADALGIPSLAEMTLNGCTDLVEVHHFVGSLDKVGDLSLKKCSNTRNSSRSLKLRSHKCVSLKSLSSLKNFPAIESLLECSRSLDLRPIAVEELPSLMGCLIGHKHMYLQGCTNLMNLLSSLYQLPHLEFLSLGGCSISVKFPKKVRDHRQSMPFMAFRKELQISLSTELLSSLPTMNSSIFNHECSSRIFPALEVLYDNSSFQLKQDIRLLHEGADILVDVPNEDIKNSINMMDGIQLTKRCRNDDDGGSSEFNWYPPLKKHSSTLGHQNFR